MTVATRSRARLIVKLVLPLGAVAAVLASLHEFGGSRWPLQGANLKLVAAAIGFFLLADLLRARAWQRLFPVAERPERSTLLAGIGAAGLSSPFLPARLDCAVKLAVINRLQPAIRISTLGVSLLSLTLAEFAAMVGVSGMAALTATSGSMQLIAILVALANLGAFALLVKEHAVVRLVGRFGQRGQRLAAGLSERLSEISEVRNSVVRFAGCWLLRAAGTWALMGALGMPGLTHLLFVYLALGAASCVIPISPGGAAMAIGAGTAILLGCGVPGALATNYATSATVVAFITAAGVFLLAMTMAALSGRLPFGKLAHGPLLPLADESA